MHHHHVVAWAEGIFGTHTRGNGTRKAHAHARGDGFAGVANVPAATDPAYPTLMHVETAAAELTLTLAETDPAESALMPTGPCLAYIVPMLPATGLAEPTRKLAETDPAELARMPAARDPAEHSGSGLGGRFQGAAPVE